MTEIALSDDSEKGTKEGGDAAKNNTDKSRRDSDSSSIEMLEEFRRKSIEDEDHDEASSSSVTTTKVMKRGRGRPKNSTRKQGMICYVLQDINSTILFPRLFVYIIFFVYRTRNN